MGILRQLGVSAVSAFGVYLREPTPLATGELLISLGYLRGLQSPIRQLAKLSFSIGKAAAGVERIRETLSRSPQVDERPGAIDLPRSSGRIQFQRVTVGYREGDPVLKSVSIDIQPG